jgi:hypothetical protein
MLLVAMTCQMDDVPLRVFADDAHDEALAFIKDHSEKVPEAQLKILSMDQPDTLGISLWQFDSSGFPLSREVVRWFLDERTNDP